MASRATFVVRRIAKETRNGWTKMRHNLEETLQQLHDHLANTQDLDSSQRDKLRTMVDEIQEVLDDSDTDSAGLGSRLANAASHFEHSHPSITNTIGRIADILAQMGI